MTTNKNNLKAANRTKIDVVIVLLSASTSHFEYNWIPITDIYRIIKFKNKVKSNRAIRNQVDFLVAQGIAEYLHNRKDVRIKETPGLAIKLFYLLEETPAEAFPYYVWEWQFLYRGAYQLGSLKAFMEQVSRGYGRGSMDREGLFTRVFAAFGVVNQTLNAPFFKEIGRKLLFWLLFQRAREEAQRKKEHPNLTLESYFNSNFLDYLCKRIAIVAKNLLSDDMDFAFREVSALIEEEIRKFPELWEIIHNLFFADSETDEIRACLLTSPSAMRLILNYRAHSIGKLTMLSLVSVSNGYSIDNIIDEFMGASYSRGEQKKISVVLGGILGSTGVYQQDELNRFSNILDKTYHKPPYELEEDQEFRAMRLELWIKGILRHNEYLNVLEMEQKSPMLIAMRALQHVDIIDDESNAGSPFYNETFKTPRSVYRPYEIDQLIGHR